MRTKHCTCLASRSQPASCMPTRLQLGLSRAWLICIVCEHQSTLLSSQRCCVQLKAIMASVHSCCTSVHHAVSQQANHQLRLVSRKLPSLVFALLASWDNSACLTQVLTWQHSCVPYCDNLQLLQGAGHGNMHCSSAAQAAQLQPTEWHVAGLVERTVRLGVYVSHLVAGTDRFWF
jgi:hypothetical protein